MAISSVDLRKLGTLVLAGGGNRCWWQAGALTHLLENDWSLPRQIVGTSAGAAVAAACITRSCRAALSACTKLYADNHRILDWSRFTRLQLRFAHQRIYPAWIGSFLTANSFAAILSSGTKLRVALARPARALGLTGSVIAGTLAYMVDKYLARTLHPRLPRLLGLRLEFLDMHSCKDSAEARTLLMAAAAAPPIMRAVRIGGKPAFDGGYADSASIHWQSRADRLETLVLLTRHYPQLPLIFRFNDRCYWQPSQPIPVSTWDCTKRTTVEAAFTLGERDAAAALSSRAFTP